MGVGAVYLLLKIVKTPDFLLPMWDYSSHSESPTAAERFSRDKSRMCLHLDCEAHRHDRVDMKIPLNWKFPRDSKNGLQNEI